MLKKLFTNPGFNEKFLDTEFQRISEIERERERKRQRYITGTRVERKRSQENSFCYSIK